MKVLKEVNELKTLTPQATSNFRREVVRHGEDVRKGVWLNTAEVLLRLNPERKKSGEEGIKAPTPALESP